MNHDAHLLNYGGSRRVCSLDLVLFGCLLFQYQLMECLFIIRYAFHQVGLPRVTDCKPEIVLVVYWLQRTEETQLCLSYKEIYGKIMDTFKNKVQEGRRVGSY